MCLGCWPTGMVVLLSYVCPEMLQPGRYSGQAGCHPLYTAITSSLTFQQRTYFLKYELAITMFQSL